MTATPPRIGQPAPDFTLASTAGGEVTLSSFRGQSTVLLAFFPLAFTGTCTAEMCDFTSDLNQFNDVDARVLGISVDAVPSLKAFAAQNGIEIDLLSDFRREASRAYGTLMEETFFSNRAYFIIDREGTLRWSFVEDTPGTKRPNDELLAQLRAL